MTKKTKYILFFTVAAFALVAAVIYFKPTENPSAGTAGNLTPKNTISETETGEIFSEAEVEAESEVVTGPINENELWVKLDTLSETIQDFYTKNYELTRLISKDGLLYNKASEKNLTLEIFRDRYELIDESLVVPNTSVCLMRPSDFSEYSDKIKPLSDSQNLVIFIVTHDKSNNKYYICSKDDGSGVLESKDYLSVKDKYLQDHGAAGRRFSTDKKYKEVLKAINSKEGYTGECFVRYLAADEKYACAVISPRDDYSIIKQYVLEINSNGGYDIKISELEREPRVFVAINNLLPDLNLALIPYYTIANEIDFMYYNFADITTGLQSQGNFDKELITNIKFASATDKYMYIMYDSGIQFFGIKIDGIWNISDIQDVTDPEYAMLADSQFAPLFILLQNS